MLTLDQIILSHADSSIQIGDGTDFLAINGDGSLNAVVSATDLDIRNLTFATDTVDVSGSSVTVSATDLDIRNLANSQDSVAIGDASAIFAVATGDAVGAVATNGMFMMGIRQDAAGSPVSADGDFHPFIFNDDGELKVAADLTSQVADDAADSGNPIKVGGRGVSGALTALSASGDRFHLLGDLYRRTYVNTSYNIGIKTSAASVTTTAAQVLATALAGRRSVTIQNKGNQSVFLVHSGATAKTDGLEIPKYASATFEMAEDIDIYMVADAGTQDVRFLEAG